MELKTRKHYKDGYQHDFKVDGFDFSHIDHIADVLIVGVAVIAAVALVLIVCLAVDCGLGGLLIGSCMVDK